MPDKSGISRRDIFQIIGSVPAIAAVKAGDAAAATPNGGPYKRQTFDDHQWRTVRVLCDLILPADERGPSATAAGVAEFLDDWIAFRTDQEGNQDLRAEILGGLMWLDHESRKLTEKDFADASTAQQKQMLDRIAYPARAAKDDHPGVSFFNNTPNKMAGLQLGVYKNNAYDSGYTFSVNQVEKLTGLNFFNALPAAEQNRLERTIKELPVQ